MKTTDSKGKNLKSDGREMDMANSALHELFLSELKDIYWAEKYLVKNLPDMAEKAQCPDLKAAIESHLTETEGHVTRLEEVFESLNEKASAKKCEAMAGLVDEAKETIGETDEASPVRDVAIISCAQKVEHYEIATYGTLRTLAQIMGHSKAVELLSATLDEEKKADSKLSEIAEDHINEDAKNEVKQ
ncbi:MAG: rubrerythrin family protein [Bacteroidota bacterium]|nr:rubrerythrin family protein [Bacteroidota bacterium]